MGPQAKLRAQGVTDVKAKPDDEIVLLLVPYEVQVLTLVPNNVQPFIRLRRD